MRLAALAAGRFLRDLVGEVVEPAGVAVLAEDEPGEAQWDPEALLELLDPDEREVPIFSLMDLGDAVGKAMQALADAEAVAPEPLLARPKGDDAAHGEDSLAEQGDALHARREQHRESPSSDESLGLSRLMRPSGERDSRAAELPPDGQPRVPSEKRSDAETSDGWAGSEEPVGLGRDNDAPAAGGRASVVGRVRAQDATESTQAESTPEAPRGAARARAGARDLVHGLKDVEAQHRWEPLWWAAIIGGVSAVLVAGAFLYRGCFMRNDTESALKEGTVAALHADFDPGLGARLVQQEINRFGWQWARPKLQLALDKKQVVEYRNAHCGAPGKADGEILALLREQERLAAEAAREAELQADMDAAVQETVLLTREVSSADTAGLDQGLADGRWALLGDALSGLVAARREELAREARASSQEDARARERAAAEAKAQEQREALAAVRAQLAEAGVPDQVAELVVTAGGCSGISELRELQARHLVLYGMKELPADACITKLKQQILVPAE